MLRYTEIANNIFDAIDIILDKKLEKLQLDSSLICRIESDGEIDTQTGLKSFRVKYQDTFFNAYPIGANAYQKGDYVCVLISNSDMRRKKYILGLVKGATSTTDAASQITVALVDNPLDSILEVLEDLAFGRADAAKEKIKKLRGGNE